MAGWNTVVRAGESKRVVNGTWGSKEWKRNRDAFLKAHPFCLWHGPPVKATVPHHPHRRGSLSQRGYLSLKGCVPLCQKCHYAARKRMKLCPLCKQHYFKPRHNRKVCWECFIRTPFGQAVKKYYEEKQARTAKRSAIIKRKSKISTAVKKKPKPAKN